MNKKVAALILLFTIGTATAAIPIAAIVGGFILGGIVVGGLEYWFGVRSVQAELEQIEQAYNSYMVNDTYQDAFYASNLGERSAIC